MDYLTKESMSCTDNLTGEYSYGEIIYNCIENYALFIKDSVDYFVDDGDRNGLEVAGSDIVQYVEEYNPNPFAPYSEVIVKFSVSAEKENDKFVLYFNEYYDVCDFRVENEKPVRKYIICESDSLDKVKTKEKFMKVLKELVGEYES